MTMYEFEVIYDEPGTTATSEILFRISANDFKDAWTKAVEKAFAHAGNDEVSSITVMSMYNMDL